MIMVGGDKLDDDGAAAIKTLVEAFRSHAQVTAPEASRSVAQAGVAWTIRVLRTAQAIVELHRAGLADTASPMVRSVMEHAISMLWLVERRGEAVRAIEYGHRQHQRRLRDSALAYGWDLSDLDPAMASAPLDRAMIEPEDLPRLNSFEQRMKDPIVRSWYPAYRIESSLSHASYLSGAVYVDDNRVFVWEGVVPATPLRATAVFAVMAVQALNEILDYSQALVEAVDEAIVTLGMATT
jgi:hypothetical protein